LVMVMVNNVLTRFTKILSNMAKLILFNEA